MKLMHAAERDAVYPQRRREWNVADRTYEGDHRDQRSDDRVFEHRPVAVTLCEDVGPPLIGHVHAEKSRHDETREQLFAQHGDVAERVTRTLAVVAGIAQSLSRGQRRRCGRGTLAEDLRAKRRFSSRARSTNVWRRPVRRPLSRRRRVGQRRTANPAGSTCTRPSSMTRLVDATMKIIAFVNEEPRAKSVRAIALAA